MAGLVSTGSIPRALWPGINQIVGLAYKEKDQQWRDIFNIKQADKNYMEEMSMGPTGLMTLKPEGSGITYQSYQQGFTKTYKMATYSTGVIVSREAIEDNVYVELANAQSEMIGRSARITKEILGANILNNAFDSNYSDMYDGKPLCDTGHKLEKGGTFSNELSTSADLSEASLEEMAIQIRDYRDGANKLINVMPRKVIVPSELCFDIKRILGSDLQNDTANNAINALKHKNIFPEGYAVNDFLTSSTAFFVLTDIPHGLTLFQRRPLEISMDKDFDSENHKWKVTERYKFGATDPRCIIGSAGSA